MILVVKRRGYLYVLEKRMKLLINLIKRSVSVIILLIVTLQFAKATTVSQVLNDLHRQNFSQATLNSVEHLLDRFVDEDDRLNDNIAFRLVDRKRLKKTLFDELKQAHGDEFCRAISHVQHILNLNGQPRNVAGPMRIVESFSDDIDVHNVNLFFRRMKTFLRSAVHSKELLWLWRILAKNMNDQEIEHCVVRFLDETDSEKFFQMHAPFQEVLQMMQGIIDKDDECQRLVDWPLISLVYPLMVSVLGYAIYNESLDSVIWLSRHDIRDQSIEACHAIRMIVDRVLEYCGDYREGRDADMLELERFIEKLVMRLGSVDFLT